MSGGKIIGRELEGVPRASPKAVRIQPKTASYEHQENRGEGSYPGEYHGPPIFRRSCLAFLSLLGCLGLSFRGWGYLDDKRVFLGAACLIASLLVGLGGMGLWFVTGFPATWGWPI